MDGIQSIEKSLAMKKSLMKGKQEEEIIDQAHHLHIQVRHLRTLDLHHIQAHQNLREVEIIKDEEMKKLITKQKIKEIKSKNNSRL